MAEDILRMQQEAAARVQRMQEQARRMVNRNPPPLYGPNIRRKEEGSPTEEGGRGSVQGRGPSIGPAEGPEKREKRSAGPALQEEEPEKGEGAEGSTALSEESDQLLLLFLALLLVRNGARIELVVALLYLAM